MVVTEGDISWKLVHKQTINKKHNTVFILNIFSSITEIRKPFFRCLRPEEKDRYKDV